MNYTYTISSRTHTVRVEKDGDSVRVTIDQGEPRELRGVRVQDGMVKFKSAGRRRRLHVVPQGSMRLVAHSSDVYELRVEAPGSAQGRASERGADAGGLEAAMPGQVVAVSVKDGDAVTKGQTLVILEAMKTEYRVQAPRDGQVARVLVQTGQVVERGQPLLTPAEQDEFKRPTLDKYETEGSPYYSTARLWDDGILDPPETRRVLALALSAALNAPPQATQYGIFRM